jgi:hypothetical protein
MRSVRPHSKGDRGAGLGGGAMYRFMTSNILNRLLSDNQVDASEFTGRSIRAAGEHDSARGHDGVERAVLEGKIFGIPEVILDRQRFRFGFGSRRVEEIARDINADHRRAAPRDDTRGPACPGR